VPPAYASHCTPSRTPLVDPLASHAVFDRAICQDQAIPGEIRGLARMLESADVRCCGESERHVPNVSTVVARARGHAYAFEHYTTMVPIGCGASKCTLALTGPALPHVHMWGLSVLALPNAQLCTYGPHPHVHIAFLSQPATGAAPHPTGLLNLQHTKSPKGISPDPQPDRL
jgi:hypothetical protein